MSRNNRWPRQAKVAIALLSIVFLVEASVLGSSSPGQAKTQPTTTTVGTTTTATVEAPTTAQETAPTSTSGPVTTSLEETIAALTVAPELPGVGYSRDLFVHWIDADRNGCDTRCEVLVRQKRFDLPGLVAGGWLSVYDGYTTDDASELDVDHVIPLHEAWISGADGWDSATRQAFANDLNAPELLAVTAAMNRSKGDRDPASWQPPNRGDWCDYVRAWVAVKAKWSLTADQAEVQALRNMATAASCG